MPVWKMSAEDYAKLKASDRHHFLHLNATSHAGNKSHFHMTFSDNAAKMISDELGIKLLKIHPKGHHPEESIALQYEDLIKTAKCAPGFNREGKLK